MMFAHGVTVARSRPVPQTDAYGDTVATTYGAPVDVAGCAPYIEALADVVAAGRSAVVSRLVVLCPFDADLAAGDRIVWEGQTWEARSQIERRRNPFTGWEAGASITFELVEG